MTTYGYIYKIDYLNDSYIGKHEGEFDLKYFGYGKRITAIIKKYGITVLHRILLAWAWSKNELNDLEISYIAHYKPTLNLTSGGDGGVTFHGKPTEKQLLAIQEGIKRRDERWKQSGLPHWTKGRNQSWVSNTNKLLKSKQMKGRHWFNNGSNEVFTFECPQSYKSGRLYDFLNTKERKIK